ncbi:MAG: DUF6198 family protein [Lachnospiraceae bacterium]|nr:DUF6198 family protein [Lachnospiraceae bacterium]
MSLSIKKLALYFGGIYCTCLGVCLVLQAGYGLDSWNGVFAGLAQKTAVSIGGWSIIIQSAFLLTAYLLTKRLEIKCVFPIAIKGVLLDFTKTFLFVMPNTNTLYGSILFFAAGYLLVGIGTGVYVATGYPKMPIDGLMWAISSAFGWSIGKARLLIEIVGFTTVLLVGGPFGVGSIVITFTIGHMIALFQKAASTLLLKVQKEN